MDTISVCKEEVRHCEPREFTDALKGSENVEEVRAGCFEEKSV